MLKCDREGLDPILTDDMVVATCLKHEGIWWTLGSHMPLGMQTQWKSMILEIMLVLSGALMGAVEIRTRSP